MHRPVVNKNLINVLVLSAMVSTPALAANAQHGKQIALQGNNKGATACQSCHGPKGGGNAAAAFPRLAGLDAGYLATQLHDFTSGKRSNAIMKPIASALTAAEIDDVAAYYAGAQAPYTAPKADTALLETGRKLVERGDWNKTIPACTQCHGPGARGVGSSFPALAGQHANYLEAQLKAWQNNTRKNDPGNLMKSVADRLSGDQIKAVSSYLASLKPAQH